MNEQTKIGKIKRVLNSSEVHFNGSGEFCFDYYCGESLNSIIRKLCTLITSNNAQITNIEFLDGIITINLSNGDSYESNSLDVRYYTKEEVDDIINNLPQGFSGDYNDLINKPSIPSDTNDLTNGAGFITISDVPSSETTLDVVSTVTVGAVNAGDTIPAGTDIQELTELLLNKTFYPTFINPTFSLSNNAGLREVGSIANFDLTFSYNRGQINGANSSGIWNPSLFQNYRAGLSSSYTLNGTIQIGNILALSTTTILGYNTYYGIVTYLQGPQPLDSKGNNYSTPYPAGTSPLQSTSFEGIYPYFYFKSSSTITPSIMQAAISNGAATKVLGSSLSTLNITFNANGEYIAFAYPDSSPTKTIWYINALNTGSIGGSSNLFSSATVNSVNSPSSYWNNINFKIHISNYPTSTSGVMELRNN